MEPKTANHLFPPVPVKIPLNAAVFKVLLEIHELQQNLKSSFHLVLPFSIPYERNKMQLQWKSPQNINFQQTRPHMKTYWSIQLKQKSIYQEPDGTTIKHYLNYTPFKAFQVKSWHHCIAGITSKKLTAVSSLKKILSNKLQFRKLL